MGTATPALAKGLALGLGLTLALAARVAHADPCTATTDEGGRFAACFDVGNRLSLTAGTEGYGGGIAIRHIIDFEDEPDLVWKMDHQIADVTAGFVDGEITGELYRGRFLRHARDGHIVLPFGSPPKNVFLPFDIGALVDVGRLRWLRDGRSQLDVVDTAVLFDFARTRDFRTRFAVGPIASWEVAFDHDQQLAVVDQRVAPFSALVADLHLESRDGLTFGDVRLEGGSAWHTATGWARRARAEAVFERIVMAINDRPIALFANAVYDSDSGEAIAGVGLRVVIVQHRDPRVSLDPPTVGLRGPAIDAHGTPDARD